MHKSVCPEIGGSAGGIQEPKEEQWCGMRSDRRARPHHTKESSEVKAIAGHGTTSVSRKSKTGPLLVHLQWEVSVAPVFHSECLQLISSKSS